MAEISPLAGKPAPASILVDVTSLIDAYHAGRPDPSVPAQRVVFGTSGHRESYPDKGFRHAVNGSATWINGYLYTNFNF